MVAIGISIRSRITTLGAAALHPICCSYKNKKAKKIVSVSREKKKKCKRI